MIADTLGWVASSAVVFVRFGMVRRFRIMKRGRSHSAYRLDMGTPRHQGHFLTCSVTWSSTLRPDSGRHPGSVAVSLSRLHSVNQSQSLNRAEYETKRHEAQHSHSRTHAASEPFFSRHAPCAQAGQ